MNFKTRTLVTIGLTAALLTSTAHRGFALGPGGFGWGTIGADQYNITNAGPLSGQWDVSGGVTGWGSVLNNTTPNNAGNPTPNAGVSNGSAILHIVKNDGIVQVVGTFGQWQTPIMGLTTDNGATNSLASFGSPDNPHDRSNLNDWITLAPSKHWSISFGQMPSLEGLEGAVEFTLPTMFSSDLNALYLGGGVGPQLNLFYGPATLQIQFFDQNTHRFNVLDAALTYNLNADGSDYLMAYGHENIGHTGNPYQPHLGVGLGFSQANSSLMGLGAVWIIGPWTIAPEAQYQWLPQSSVSGNSKPLTTYYNVAAMADVTYAFNSVWSATGQAQYIYQNNDKNDPNAQLFGNWLGGGSPAAAGSFGPGTSMTGLQFNLTWQHQNFFARPTVAYTHLAGFTPGTGYGMNGRAANQIVGLLEIGYLLGKYPS